MKRIILSLILVFSVVSLVQAQLTRDDESWVKKERLLRSLERQLSTKTEEKRIICSTATTTVQAEIDTINLQIQQTETDLENL